MSMFRAKKLDLGCFVKARTIRDHTKRKVFEQFETERYAASPNRTLQQRQSTKLSARRD